MYRPILKVATDINILDLRTRYRSKFGWFFWFGPIHVTIRRNLANTFYWFVLTLNFTQSALPSFCTADAAYPPGFKKPEEEETKDGDDDEGAATVTGDMFVSLVAKCPIQVEMNMIRASDPAPAPQSYFQHFLELDPFFEIGLTGGICTK